MSKGGRQSWQKSLTDLFLGFDMFLKIGQLQIYLFIIEAYFQPACSASPRNHRPLRGQCS